MIEQLLKLESLGFPSMVANISMEYATVESCLADLDKARRETTEHEFSDDDYRLAEKTIRSIFETPATCELLIDSLADFCNFQDLPSLSADELLLVDGITDDQSSWLKLYMVVWDNQWDNEGPHLFER